MGSIPVQATKLKLIIMNANSKGSIPANVGFTPSATGGQVKRAITRKHTNADRNKQFTDNFGRTYTYTQYGCIY